MRLTILDAKPFPLCAEYFHAPPNRERDASGSLSREARLKGGSQGLGEGVTDPVGRAVADFPAAVKA